MSDKKLKLCYAWLFHVSFISASLLALPTILFMIYGLSNDVLAIVATIIAVDVAIVVQIRNADLMVATNAIMSRIVCPTYKII
ncbi:MAG: hypothetical protein M3044_04245 [Thermoproteota archaeon]|nr:hypothetical protein [Thermoproteota archaeon]